MDFPERLQRSDKDDEQEEDVLPRGAGLNNRPFTNMNQSIFGLIAASNVDFHDRFEGHSSEEEDSDGAGGKTPKSRHETTADHMAQTSILIRPGSDDKKSRRKQSGEHKLMKSVPLLSKLSSKKRSKKEEKKTVLKIQEESEPESSVGEELSSSQMHGSSLAPVMSRMLEARAEAAARPSFDLERPSTDKSGETLGLTGTGPTELSKRLQKIFELEEAEDLIAGQFEVRCKTECLGNANSYNRISLLAAPKCNATRLHLHYHQAYLLLLVSSQEGC